MGTLSSLGPFAFGGSSFQAHLFLLPSSLALVGEGAVALLFQSFPVDFGMMLV